VSRLRIRSEHCNGAIKGRWQSLKGLRIAINRKQDHARAMDWISACFVLHNIAVDVEGAEWVDYYVQKEADPLACGAVEVDDSEDLGLDEVNAQPDGGARRRQLVEDYFQHYQAQHSH
jgi:hypothetical protein